MSGILALERQPVASTKNFAGNRDVPCPGCLIEISPLDTGVERDVAAQVETIGDMVGVFQDLRLRRVTLAPVPLLLQLL